MGKLMLIDGNSIAFRAFYALPLLSNKQGLHTNAVFGFTTMLLRVLEEHQPTHFLIAFDAGKSTFRHQTYAEYKGGRAKTPPELSEQFPLIKELIDACGIRRFESEQFEADDIIGTVARLAEQNGLETVIVSGDKDLLQIVSNRTTMALTRKGISEMDCYSPERLREVYGLTAAQIPDLKGLMGDSSDNIPGVPGVGEKTALKLLHEFGTIEQVLASVEQIKGKLREKIESHAEDALLSKRLATIETQMPIEFTLADLKFAGIDRGSATRMFRKLEFKSLLDKWGDDGAVTESSAPSGGAGAPVISENDDGTSLGAVIQTVTEPALSLTVVGDVEELAKVVEQLPQVVALHAECPGEHPHHASLLGIALASQSAQYWVPAQLFVEQHESVVLLKKWLATERMPKAVHDLNRTTVVLGWHGIKLQGATFDSSLAAYLLNPTDTQHSLHHLAAHYGLPTVPSDESFYGKGAKFALPADFAVLAEHAARKARCVVALQPLMTGNLVSSNMQELYLSMELPLASILARLELTGVAVNGQQLREYGAELSAKINSLMEHIYEQAGEQFNINSTKQLGEILFDKLQLPAGKKTKTGYSTDAEELERLAPYSQIVRDLLHYRQLTKLNSTYVEGLLKEIHPKTGNVHTYFNQTTTATGRLSSQFPNLQNIPIRLEEGRYIRKAFEPSEPGWSILAADYSQIELRILAHISDDRRMIDAFLNDLDIHSKTAMDVFGVSEAEVDANMRRQAKAVNFGIVYGISDYGLSQNLGITRKQAASFIEQYFSVFSGVKAYMERIVKQAKADGFVLTLLNRRRYLPDIRSSNFNLRSFAERTAMNTPIQGTAADIIKLAMVQMQARMAEAGVRSRMLLQVHDELVFEVPEDERERMEALVRDVMEHAFPLSVPLKVDISCGANWYEAK